VLFSYQKAFSEPIQLLHTYQKALSGPIQLLHTYQKALLGPIQLLHTYQKVLLSASTTIVLGLKSAFKCLDNYCVGVEKCF